MKPKRKEDIMKKGLVFPVAMAALALSGCSGGAGTAAMTKAEKDEIYIEMVRDEYPSSTSRDSSLLELAHASCAAFDRGGSKMEVFSLVASEGGAATMEISYAIGAAVAIYCPEHEDKVTTS